MNTRKMLTTAVLVAGSTLWLPAVAQDRTPTVDELWAIVQAQQAEIEALRSEVREAREQAAAAESQAEEADAKVEATGDYLETLAVADGGRDRVSIGAYGELHYNQIESDAGDSEEIDFHRFVLFFGHEFTDRIRFFSEFELEHSLAGDGAPGEVELEQAYVDYIINDSLTAKTGLFLMPVGILNETHEPTTFYGVERNDVENVLIPSTWWEAGAGLSGRFANGLSWDVALHSGLAMPTEGGSAFRVRSGRQKVAEALASDFAFTGRLRYTGVRGLELAASYQYQSDPSQLAGDGLDKGQLFTTHAIYNRGRFGLRALYAGWQFDGDAVEAAGADDQSGWYIEPSFRISDKWGVYARYEDIDAARDADQFTQNEFGFNYWPTDGVVLKVDYRQRDFSLPGLAEEDFDALDLGFGYSF
ncbi:MAG: porin [Woeseiaceae bacterium]|nr:porin [Woeseiaceae bacterium]